MVPYSAVVVWELRGLIEDVHCYFTQRQGGYVLSIERAGERLLEELHDDVQEMMRRARELRTSLVRVGFEPVPAGDGMSAATESLLTNFVRVGTAPLGAAGPRPC
jgi:hypothetical protein